MLNIKGLNLIFGQRAVFDNASFNINEDQKIGLVGRNGSGKTTLLKIVAGLQNIDSGSITIQKDCKIAYMPQEVVLLSDKSIFQEAFSVFKELIDLEEEAKELEKFLHQDLSEDDHDKIDRYAHIHQELAELNSTQAKIETKKVLLGLGFKEENFDNRVDTLSVGWKMRLILAKLLLQRADFYLFDEPTNHLDLVAKDWFLDFLKKAKFGFLIVCHDRYFLDHLCDYIMEVDRGNLKTYRGNYSHYLKQKDEASEVLEKKYVEQQKYVKQQKATIERFRASATKAKMAQSMIKSLKKIDLIEPEHKLKTVRFNFSNIKRSGKVVLKVKDLSKFYDDKKIFQNVSFEIERGQKVAIVAPNGVGKTTLLSVVTGSLKDYGGSFEFGYNVEPVIFEQDQNRSLNPKNTILEEAENSCSTTEQRAKVRSFLGSFLFPGDDVYKKIRVLSGGEKNRVAMVKVLLQDANLLILDEPTNHLDLQSKEILLNALNQFSGTILFVSHDRDFLNHLATDIIILSSDGVEKFAGNYDSYLYQGSENEKDLQSVKSKGIKDKTPKSKQEKKEEYEKRKKINNLEKKIERLENKKTQLNAELSELIYGTQEYDETNSKLQDVEKLIKETLRLWEKLSA